MFDDLKKNLLNEKNILNDLEVVSAHSSGSEKIFVESIASLLGQLKILNKSISSLLKNPDSEGDKMKNVSRFSYVSPSTKEKKYVALDKKDKGDFLKELSFSEKTMGGIRKQQKVKGEISKPSEIARISNKFFGNFSEKLVPKFDSLSDDLKKANIHFLLSTYISIAIFISFCLIFLGVFVSIFLVFFGFSFWYFSIIFILPALSLVGFYFYPVVEKGSVEKGISYELPFATIHMAAIAGSDLEPTKIFKIIAMSQEYPHVGREVRKVINQVDIYGYDLVTALKNVSQNTSNKKLIDLFNGLATNISSGGDLRSYLEKKSENYLMDYKLERRRYSDLAGTFMDIYISVLIAAPLVLMMLFIVMNVSGLSAWGDINSLTFLSVAIVVLANILFLIFLQLKQPEV